MKCQNLFSWKNKKIISICGLLKISPSMLMLQRRHLRVLRNEGMTQVIQWQLILEVLIITAADVILILFFFSFCTANKA